MSQPRTYARPSAQKKPLPIVPIAIGVVVLALAIGIGVALLAGGDDGSSSTTADGAGGDVELAATGSVAVDGTALPEFTTPEGDPAVGLAAPRLSGLAPDGTPVEVGGAGEPTLISFLAHWCPHCQAEVPLLVDMAEAGSFEGVRTVGVLTGTNPDAPNYPPAEWLIDEDWSGDVLLDDQSGTAAAAYGLSGYPLLVALDAEGNVVARASGELPEETVQAMVDAARG